MIRKSQKNLTTTKKKSIPSKIKSSLRNRLTSAKSSNQTVTAVRFGDIGENSLIYLKEGVESKVDEVKDLFLQKESIKKTALSTISDLNDLPVTCTTNNIRERLNVVVTTLQNVFEAL